MKLKIMFSVKLKKTSAKKKALILKTEEKDGKEKKKKAPFSQAAQITHRHRKVTNAIHERMHHKQQHLFILNFFFSK